MTERFTETVSTGIVTDTLTGIEYNCEMRIDDDFLNLVNTIADENEQLKQQMQRLYNYFADWFDGRVLPSDFSEMWDFVKEDEKWD